MKEKTEQSATVLSTGNKSKELKNGSAFQCKICSKTFAKKSYLTKHGHIHKERRFSCSVCEKDFTHKHHLEGHMKIHLGVKDFSCCFCNKQFYEPQKLDLHKKTHTGIKPHKCPLCNKAFIQKQHLRVHLETHNGSKSFVCGTCGKSFVSKSNLVRHEKKHSGGDFLCDVCSTRFTRRYLLLNHIFLNHKETKVFQCTFCGMMFVKKDSFAFHMKMHKLKRKSRMNEPKDIQDCSDLQISANSFKESKAITETANIDKLSSNQISSAVCLTGIPVSTISCQISETKNDSIQVTEKQAKEQAEAGLLKESDDTVISSNFDTLCSTPVLVDSKPSFDFEEFLNDFQCNITSLLDNSKGNILLSESVLDYDSLRCSPPYFKEFHFEDDLFRLDKSDFERSHLEI